MVRNSFGEFIAARTCFLGGAGSALCAEALAWRAAMDFCVGTRFDCDGGGFSSSGGDFGSRSCMSDRGGGHCGKIFDGQRLVLCGVSSSLSVRRTANSVAHVLASSGLRGSGIKTWESRPPLWLLNSIEHDNLFL